MKIAFIIPDSIPPAINAYIPDFEIVFIVFNFFIVGTIRTVSVIKDEKVIIKPGDIDALSEYFAIGAESPYPIAETIAIIMPKIAVFFFNAKGLSLPIVSMLTIIHPVTIHISPKRFAIDGDSETINHANKALKI